MLTHLNARRSSCGALLIIIFAISGCAIQRPGSAPPISAPSTPTQSNSTTSSTSVPPEVIPPGYVKSYVVFGKRYYILGSSRGFRQTGLASWYGPKFHGRKTANGEIYDMHQMTAAHKNLPLPTYVRVTNLENRRSIVVRVNDRGPFIGERIIDLSYAAAKELDLVGPGTGQVEVVALTESDVATPVPRMPPGIATPAAFPDNQPMTNSPNAVTNTGLHAGGFIQVAAFGSNSNALEMRRQLEQSGFNNVIIQNVQLDGRLLHRVKLGPYATADEQNEALSRLHAIGLSTARTVNE